jgi:hypothetical protein
LFRHRQQKVKFPHFFGRDRREGETFPPAQEINQPENMEFPVNAGFFVLPLEPLFEAELNQ